MRRWWGGLVPVIGGLAVGLVVAGPALACGKGAVLFADHFRHGEPYWPVMSRHVAMRPGALRVTPPQNANWYVFYPGMPYARADACVTLSIGRFHAAGDMGAGIMFWTADRRHGDVFMIRPDGRWILAGHAGRAWQAVATGRSAAIHTGAHVTNEVEVRLDGSRGEALVNGREVTTFRGAPPPGRAAFGFYAESEVDRADTWTFHAMVVRDLTAPLPPVPAARPAGPRRPG